MTKWHSITAPETLAALGTDSARGLDGEEASRRLKTFGPNLLTAKKAKSLLVRVLEQFQDVLIYILLAAAVISILLGEISDAVIILAVVVINAVVGAAGLRASETALRCGKRPGRRRERSRCRSG